MNFSTSLKRLREGDRMTRASWPSAMWVTLFENECILLHAGKGWGIWKPKQEDLLGVDWVHYQPLGDKQGKLHLETVTTDDRDCVPMPEGLRDQIDSEGEAA